MLQSSRKFAPLSAQQLPIHQNQLKQQVSKSSNGMHHLNRHQRSLQTNTMLGTLVLIIIGLCLYIAVIIKLNNSLNQNAVLSNFPLEKLKNTKQSKQKHEEKSLTENVSDEDKQQINQQWIQNWIKKIKNLSTEITIQKLQRAEYFLKNLTQQIEPFYFDQQKIFFQKDYKIFSYPEKPICVVVPTYNNVQYNRYQYNIDSILQQNYTNYRVIVIDDVSIDMTAQNIQDYIIKKDYKAYKQGKVSIAKNKDRKMALGNILYAAENYCLPQQIFMVVDGDDYLLGKLVFKLFNAAFSSTDSWVVYSNFLTTTGKVGYSRRYPTQIIKNRNFRRVLFIISHLRAFYTKLILNINKTDLLDEQGKLFHAANDVAIFMPILEMASENILYLPEINYYYNANTGHNNHIEKKKQQIRNDRFIRSKPKYKRLKSLFQVNL